MALKKSNETGKAVHEVAQWSRHGTRTARKTYLDLGVGKYFSPWTQLQSRPLFSSVQDRIYALGKAHISSQLLSDVSQTLSLKRFQCSSD